jgi:5'(3')-deoxyribonucleotidase
MFLFTTIFLCFARGATRVIDFANNSDHQRKMTRFQSSRQSSKVSLAKLKIAVDLDGVLAESMLVWCERANEEFGTRLKMEDIDSWSWWKKLPISKDDFYRILDESWDEWREIPPTEPEIAEKVARIEKFGSLDIVTGRSKRTVEAARCWIDNQNIRYRNFVRVLGWRDKILLNYDVYVDDAPDLMPLISRSPGAWGVLYERPWNRSVGDMPRVQKAKSWRQVPALLKLIQASKS